jgi:hypothetical protein
MPQFGRPTTDTTIGTFTDQAGGTTNIFQSIDEAAADDADYIKSVVSPASAVYVTKLSATSDPALSTGHIMRMRTSTDQDGQEAIDFTQELRQGYTNEGSQGTLISTSTRTGVNSTVWTTTTKTLSGAEADAITDYTNLYYRFVVNKP